MQHKPEAHKKTPPPQLLSSALKFAAPSLWASAFSHHVRLRPPSLSCLRSPSCSVQCCTPAPFTMARHMALFSMLLILLASTVPAAQAEFTAAGASKDQLISAICSGGALECVASENHIALPLDTSSDAIVDDMRDSSIGTINDLQRDFFLEAALVEGGSLTLDGNLRDPAPRRPFLTSAAAAAMPTSARDMIRSFGLARGSTAAKDVATAAYLCGNPALPGEAFRCAASLDAVGAFVAAQLGRNVKVYKTTGAPSSAPAVKAPVKIMGVAKGSVKDGKVIVVCHHVAFPAMLFYCHRVTGTKVVRAALKPTAGRTINAVGVCHLDTSMWLSRHPAFKALPIAHGDAACHFLVENDVVFTAAESGSA